ncbi:L-lactate dehydrogenase [Paramagnetospirillum magnetotacticum MS-1]|uniref:L-lactate dehydrogenase n=1 Tax=Paramagnetospirillum magnetotacticum MS-1 TaxID=272627 RepID=A0A0C2YS48_PARME|nr:alpha-hydroxy acid oxidase [Paramagnetospirillum magnetotacticum]KIL97958.1 L-lactate dehydrogenase [Paramagnetospirillum magnetotacticum MS-1]
MSNAASIGDLAKRARWRIPGFAFGFLDGGSGEEDGLRRNRDRLEAVILAPKACTGAKPDTTATLFGRDYRLPFGAAPVGMGNLLWPGADLMVARQAARLGFPVVASTVATTALEDIAKAADGNAWFQLYVSREERINRDLLARAWAAGIRELVVTVDVPVAGDRRRDLRNRFVLPFKPGARFVAQLAMAPFWALSTLKHGSPGFPNLARYVGEVDGKTLAGFISSQIKDDLTWDDLKSLRDQWQGRMLVKGIMTASDAKTALGLGADGIWVSNHGGRQLDSAPAAIDSLSAIRAALGPDPVVVMDGGIRSGEDVVRAGATGADFVFCGRAFYYGAAAAGEAGAARAADLLAADLKRTLIQIGCPSWSVLDDGWLWR